MAQTKQPIRRSKRSLRRRKRRIIATSILGLFVLAITITIIVGASGTAQTDTPLLLSIQELDGVFNPFFSSSAPDSEVVGMTQISMLGNNSKGEVTYGEKEGVVVEDYQYIYNTEDDTSTYYFVLKNNVKFSNGSPLTIKDVLFNLYVYLDPVYSGSSTIYSTKIIGLNEYRTQVADEKEQDRFMEQFQIGARTRILNFVNAVEDIYDENENKLFSKEEFIEVLQNAANELNDQNLMNDFNKVCELFNEELEKDYKGSLGEAYKSVEFKNEEGITSNVKLTTDVEMFLYNEGYLYYNAKEDKLESSFTSNPQELKNWTKEQAIGKIIEDKIPMGLVEIVSFWNTANEFYDYLVNTLLEEYHQNNERLFKNISGIKFINKDQDVVVNNKTYNSPTYLEDGSVNKDSNEVLSITIEGVDPKAIWNFAFTVAPMYYYSDEEHIKAFDYEANFGVEYSSIDFMNNVIKDPNKIGVPVGAGPYQACDSNHSTENVQAGDFKSNNILYFSRNEHYVLGSPNIKYLHYQVVNSSGLLNALYNSEVDFVQPNAKLETINELTGKRNEGIAHEQITTSGYGYIGINAGFVPDMAIRQAIMHSIDTSLTVSYYGGSAEQLYRSLSSTSWVYDYAYQGGLYSYYPYIGGKIPANYKDPNAKLNPAYVEFAESKGKRDDGTDTFTEEEQKEFIIKLVTSAGYSIGGDNIYANDKTGNKLKYTFTIAGSDVEHPAFNAFFQASKFLNSINWDITVTTDALALSKLASGDLAVWAAAWSSTIDPDMYQVYHMNSSATATWNWGYRQILNNKVKYSAEYAILEELSEWIEKGRETTDVRERSLYYEKALDLVMQLAVELPTYQRDDLFAYNYEKIDEETLNEDLSPYTGLLADIHSVRLNRGQ